MKKYEVWMEGYQATGQHCPHKFVGEIEAESFKEACSIAVKELCKASSCPEDFDRYYDEESCSFWGLRCFDNEKDSMRPD